jgi:hypothetical protein
MSKSDYILFWLVLNRESVPLIFENIKGGCFVFDSFMVCSNINLKVRVNFQTFAN